MKNVFINHQGFSSRIIAIILAIALLMAIPSVSFGGVVLAVETVKDEKSEVNIDILQEDGLDYFSKYDTLSSLQKSNEIIKFDFSSGNIDINQNKQIANIEGSQGVVIGNNNKWIEWEFTVEDSGTFIAELEYSPLTDKITDIIASVSIDGEYPFTESENLYLPRAWGYDYEIEKDKRPFKIDSRGNEVTPTQEQKNVWIKHSFGDSQGLYDEPYMFYLEKGTHKLRLAIKDSPIVLKSFKLFNESYPSYEDYIKEYSLNSAKGSDKIILQAELATATNKSSINPTSDKLNAATEPNNPTCINLNTIGASNWINKGDSVSWKANVEKEGLYRIAFKARQNVNAGLISYRNLYINGEVPFEEALNIPFEYSQSWKIYNLGGEDEKLVYLKPGDIITLECSSGSTAEVMRNVQKATTELNALYREIIGITSVQPDTYQDYKLEKRIPGIEEKLEYISDLLSQTHSDFLKVLNSKGSLASSIKYVADIFKEFSEKPYLITEKLSSFKSGIETLGSLILTLGQQPLEIDYMIFMQEDAVETKAETGFFTNLKFGISQFLASFVNDYAILEENEGKTINVWVSTGRDQAQILDNLIMSDFTKETGINVELNMVDTGTTLIRASLADKGPDVALMIPQGTPVELAAREALVDLTDYITDDIYDDFHESAWKHFYYQDKLYAMPETQTFNVMYYRTDIFEEMGLNPPNTWDEFYEALAVIKSKNLGVGISEIDSANLGVSASLSLFTALMMQRGQKSYYTDDLSKTLFDTEIAYQAFTDWSDLYTKYKIDRQIDLYSRFRSGEVPLALGSIAIYVQIQQAAPEIRGLWKMAPYPGTMKEDGSIDRSQTSTDTGCMMLKAAEKHNVTDECFEFMKWWVSADAQSKYGEGLENMLGITGRYFSANLEAFSKSRWSAEEHELLYTQRQSIYNQYSVIGNYAVNRDLTSALREVISGTNRPRRALMLRNSQINEEIKRKRIEFGLE